MPVISITSVSKRFGATLALDDISLSVPQGAFVALVGPSGCGKSTLLRLIAGFEAPDAGQIAFDDRIVAGPKQLVPPEDRAISMIFQSYALWPHMSVSDNVGYALRVAGRPAAEIAARVEAGLAHVGLAHLAGRRPEMLSGGERQRVALARALVQETDIILCDEPLANLDAHLRASMVATFADLSRDARRSFVYVTHDQAEALALASHVAVMDRGRILQFGTPEEIYRRPASRRVADFIGRGATIAATVMASAGDDRITARIGDADVIVRCGVTPADGRGLVLVRPEAIRPDGPLSVTVARTLYRGHSIEVEGRLATGETLNFDWPEPVAVGTVLGVTISDAWLLPDPA